MVVEKNTGRSLQELVKEIYRQATENDESAIRLLHDGHTVRWSAEEQARYERIAEQASEVVTLAPHYFRGCMQIRNRYMVDRAAVCVCYLTETKGGTVNTVNYARKRGLSTYNLAEGADAE